MGSSKIPVLLAILWQVSTSPGNIRPNLQVSKHIHLKYPHSLIRYSFVDILYQQPAMHSHTIQTIHVKQFNIYWNLVVLSTTRTCEAGISLAKVWEGWSHFDIRPPPMYVHCTLGWIQKEAYQPASRSLPEYLLASLPPLAKEVCKERWKTFSTLQIWLWPRYIELDKERNS
jgi:hypothetical protein